MKCSSLPRIERSILFSYQRAPVRVLLHPEGGVRRRLPLQLLLQQGSLELIPNYFDGGGGTTYATNHLLQVVANCSLV